MIYVKLLHVNLPVTVTNKRSHVAKGLVDDLINPLAPNNLYICVCMCVFVCVFVCVCVSYRTVNLQTLHFKYLLNKYTY